MKKLFAVLLLCSLMGGCVGTKVPEQVVPAGSSYDSTTPVSYLEGGVSGWNSGLLRVLPEAGAPADPRHNGWWIITPQLHSTYNALGDKYAKKMVPEFKKDSGIEAYTDVKGNKVSIMSPDAVTRMGLMATWYRSTVKDPK